MYLILVNTVIFGVKTNIIIAEQGLLIVYVDQRLYDNRSLL